MTSPQYMDFEEPPAPKAKGKKKRAKKPKQREVDRVPLVPSKEIALTGDEVRRGVSERNRAAANLKVEGFTYVEIADMLEFETPADARRAVEATLAAIHDPGDYETLRLTAVARLERNIKRSTVMADAEFLLVKNEDGTVDRVPNTDRLRWHQAAGVDIMNWATVTGAKAPTKVEITPGEAEMDRIVQGLLARSGHEDIVDADVIELEAIPALEPSDYAEYEPDDDEE